MSTDLDIYKQNRINRLNKIFVNVVSRLNSTLNTNIRNVQLSRNRNKQQLINSTACGCSVA
jgi:hypothetical protein